MKLGWHRRLAHKIGYDIDKFNKQLTVESHLRALLPILKVDLVLDVGANQGQFAETLRYIGYEGQIISFEPGSIAFGVLCSEASRDSRWQVHKVALGDEVAELKLNVSRASVFSSFHPANEFGRKKFGAAIDAPETETVEVVRLDHFLDEHVSDFSRRNVFLKMDTQGHDTAVFEGAGKYRSMFAGLQSEVAVTPIYEGIPNFDTSLSLYKSNGYEVTGLYTVNRHRATGHVIEFDCVMAPRID